MPNPFKPSFGVSPPVLVGRDGLVEEFVEALEDGPGATARSTIYTGARGSGKTVMLNEVEDRARQVGWVVISETASPGFINRIVLSHLPKLLDRFDPQAVERHVTSVTLPVVSAGATWDSRNVHESQSGLRDQIEGLTDLLAANKTGLLITLDEIHQNRIDELRQLAVAVQHAFREERELAFVGAGLASTISDVLNDEVLTFLRRSERHVLGSVGREDVGRALREPVKASERTISEDALDVMIDGTRGYPFLIQLVGAQVWRLHPTQRQISMVDARQGVSNAHRRLGSLIHEPALSIASEIDRSFLLAMAKDDGPSKMADIQKRLGVNANYASQYRLRLIDAELIAATGHGRVDFALPYLRDYLREHAASDV